MCLIVSEILISWNKQFWCNNSGFGTSGLWNGSVPLQPGSSSMCIATNCSPVKQKFSFTSKFLLFIFRINYQGNEERMLLLWLWSRTDNLVSLAPLETIYLSHDVHGIFGLLRFHYIYYHSCWVDQVNHCTFFF